MLLFFDWMHRIKAPVAVRTECSLKSCPYDVTIKTALLIPTMIPVRFLTPLLHPSRSVSVSSLNMPTAGTGRDVWPAPTFRGWRRWSLFNRKVNNIPRKKKWNQCLWFINSSWWCFKLIIFVYTHFQTPPSPIPASKILSSQLVHKLCCCLELWMQLVG